CHVSHSRAGPSGHQALQVHLDQVCLFLYPSMQCDLAHSSGALEVACNGQGTEESRHRGPTQPLRLHRGGPGAAGGSSAVINTFPQSLCLWHTLVHTYTLYYTLTL